MRDPATLVERISDNNIDGATVQLKPVRVRAVLGDFVFLIDVGDHVSFPVVLMGEASGRQPEGAVEIKAGQMLRIVGLLLPLDDLALISHAEFINDADRRILARSSHYIAALRVVVLKGGA